MAARLLIALLASSANWLANMLHGNSITPPRHYHGRMFKTACYGSRHNNISELIRLTSQHWAIGCSFLGQEWVIRQASGH